MAEQQQKYRVVGSNEVFGHAPGAVFAADLTDEQAGLLIDGGQLAKAPATAKETGGEPVQTAAARAAETAPVPQTADEAAALQPADSPDNPAHVEEN